MLAIHTHVRRPLRSAFNLIELLVVIALLGVLIGVLLGAVQKVREAANRTSCQNNLKQLALAAQLHHDAKRKFPTGVHVADTNGTTWEIELLPYCEQDKLQEKMNDTDENENVAAGKKAVTAQVIKLLLCPADPLPDPVAQCDACGAFFAVGSYGGNAGRRSCSNAKDTRDGIFFPDSTTRLADVTDGTSSTFLFGERSHSDNEFDLVTKSHYSQYYPLRGWGKWANFCYPAHHLLSTPVPINHQTPPWPVTPAQVMDRITAFGSAHPGGANFAFADGSVRFLSEQTNLSTLQALSTRAGGEVVDVP